jgi:hypothetical protein
MPAARHAMDTGGMRKDGTARAGERAGGPWQPWTVAVPCGVAFVSSGLLIVADGIVGVMGSWDTPVPGLWWIRYAIIGHCLLAAASVVLLGLGLKNPAFRRTAAILAWAILPVGFGWLVLVGRVLMGH